MKFHQTVAIFLTPSCLTRTDLIRPLVSPSDYSTNILWSQMLGHCSSIAAGCSASNLEVYLVRRTVRNVRVDLIDLQLLDLRPALRVAGQLGPVGTSKGDHQTNAGLESTENRLKITEDHIAQWHSWKKWKLQKIFWELWGALGIVWISITFTNVALIDLDAHFLPCWNSAVCSKMQLNLGQMAPASQFLGRKC